MCGDFMRALSCIEIDKLEKKNLSKKAIKYFDELVRIFIRELYEKRGEKKCEMIPRG